MIQNNDKVEGYHEITINNEKIIHAKTRECWGYFEIFSPPKLLKCSDGT